MTRIVLSLALALGLSGSVWAQDGHDKGHGDSHASSHEGHSAHGGQMHLNNGKKWETDAPLRESMTRIREKLQKSKNEQNPKALSELGETVHKEIGFMVKNCKLLPEADGVLHVAIGQLAEGANALIQEKTVAKKRRGLTDLETALSNYGKFFDHPGWSDQR